MATEKQKRAAAHARAVKAAKTRKRKQGAGLIDNIKSAVKKGHDYVKSKKLISGGLDLLGYSGAANVARNLGYGKKKKGTGAKTKLDLGLLP